MHSENVSRSFRHSPRAARVSTPWSKFGGGPLNQGAARVRPATNMMSRLEGNPVSKKARRAQRLLSDGSVIDRTEDFR